MTAEELTLRRIAVCGSGLLYWAGVMLQVRRIRKRIGHSPNLKPRGAREQALWFGWFLVVLVWIGQPFLVGTRLATPGLRLVEGFLHPLGLAVGLALLVLGYAGTLWTYSAMGNSWRMGVNANETTVLVRSGPFRWVRHPIYLLQIVMLCAVAVLLPTALSVITIALHYLCVQLKVRQEERYLAQIHGLAYHDYSAQTGGLFPKSINRRVPLNNETPPQG